MKKRLASSFLIQVFTICCSIFFLFCNYSAAESPKSLSAFGISTTDSSGFFYNSVAPDKGRIRLLNYSLAGGFALSMTWLYTQWYKDYPASSFHFFNDNGEWEQMDKFGHFWNAYNISKPIARCYRWAGVDEKKSVYIGSGVSLLFLTTIEIFDGFSEQWGFSGGDFFMNVGGAFFFSGQELLWKEQKMVLKYSFHETEYSQYNPDLLGETLPEKNLKDYNGMTYWFTVNPRSIFKNSGLPRWFSLALGYGAEGMTGGHENPTEVDGEPIPEFERYRQFYISIDFDLARIKTKSRILSSIFKLVNIIHLPAPAIELSPGRKPVYWALYF
jgi:hypothetical protein